MILTTVKSLKLPAGTIQFFYLVEFEVLYGYYSWAGTICDFTVFHIRAKNSVKSNKVFVRCFLDNSKEETSLNLLLWSKYVEVTSREIKSRTL